MANYHHYEKSGKIKTDVGELTFDNLTDDLDKLRTKGDGLKIVDKTVTDIGTTEKGKKKILAIKIGRDSSKRVLLVGCHHAREWISVEIPFLVAKYLIDNYKEKANCTTDKEKRINYLVDNAEIWIVPILNPDGHLKTFGSGDSLWRANRKRVVFAADQTIERWVETKEYFTETKKFGSDDYNLKYFRLAATGVGRKETAVVKKGVYEGVDLNRNYPAPKGPAGAKEPEWGVETHGETAPFQGGFVEFENVKDATDKGSFWSLQTSKEPKPPDTFCGPSAGSEKEVDAVVQLVAKGNFKVIVSYHNFSKVLLFPDDAAKDVGVQFLGKGMEELFKDQKNAYKYESGSGLYPTSGDTMAWAWRVHSIANYTIELPPTEADAKANNSKFNRFPPSEIQGTFEHNLPVALCAINCAISGLTPAKVASPPKGVVSAVLNCWEQLKGWKP